LYYICGKENARKRLKMKEKRIFIFSAIALLITSIFSVGFHHFDEHFQILEFAGSKLGLTETENLPWEFHKQMRPAFQPTIVVGVCQFWSLFGVDSPFFIAFFLRLITAILTFFSFKKLYALFKGEFKDERLQKWFLFFSFLLWFGVYNGVRFSSENWSGLLFVFGFSSYFLLSHKNLKSLFWIGIFLGFSFLSRYQAAFMIFGFGMWLLLIKKERIQNLISLTVGFLTIVGLGVLIDSWFYGEWTLSTWNYFDQNILHNKVSGFGVEPWWWYFTESVGNAIPPFSLLFVGGLIVLLALRPKNPVVWSILPFVLIHSLIGHKELRFLFPVIGFLPYVIVKTIEVLQDRFKIVLSKNRAMNIFMRSFVVVNVLALLVIMFKPADNQLPLYKMIYNEYSEPTTLYFVESNPYVRVIDVHFYKRSNLEIKSVKSIDEVPLNQKCLFVLTKRVDHPRLSKNVYASYPEWILKFNFNNWVDRARGWYVYELN
jgi:phosphatidylinositol glycan class B